MNTRHLTLLTAASAFALSFAAQADTVTVRDGLRIASSDGNFEATVGGRIHFDGYVNVPDRNGDKIGSGAAGDTGSEFVFRRVFLSLAGKVYDWRYHVDYDLAGDAFKDTYIAHALLPGGTLYLGQHKPWRSLDELASNNVTPFLERNLTSASGVYGGLDFTEGAYYAWQHAVGDDGGLLWAGASAYSLHKVVTGAQANTQGIGFNGRLVWVPLLAHDHWAHLGVSYSSDNADAGSSALNSAYNYGGRTGAKLTLASYAPSSAGNPHVNSVAGELAGVWGPAYAQAEFTNARFEQTGLADNTVQAWSATAAWTLTGESRGYSKANASYGAIVPRGDHGAFELAVRYEQARNDGHGGAFVGSALSGISGGASSAGPVTADRVSLLSVGLNWYASKAVRVVLDYEHGHANLGAAGRDNPNTFGARAQLAF